MADGADALTARTISSIEEIGRDAWDAFANPAGEPYNPFVSYDFLGALEASKSVGGQSGWTPAMLVLEEAGAIAGLTPLFLKEHSQGEYVFDHHWADAYERAGGRYYPKLVCAAPFTPVPGPRLLAKNDQHKQTLATALIAAARQIGVSSLHVNFIEGDDAAILDEAGFLARRGVQYHWFNRGYSSYEDFLAALSSRKRKALRKERATAASSGLEIKALQGPEITERYWDAFWLFYQDTGARKWGHPYLTRSFFRIIAETMADKLVLFIAERDGHPIAGALNFIGGEALYGRYWGAIEHHPFLHFELCYHQAIDYAIAEKLPRVEAGAQGEHKIARGYEPVETRSAHWIADPNFRQAIERYLQNERAHNEAEIDALSDYTPFKKGDQS